MNSANTSRCPAARLGALWTALLLISGPAFSAEGSFRIRGDHYELQIQPRIAPVEINRIHAWELDLRDEDGAAVEGARIKVSGGMPAHDHGLPTAPRVTQELSAGRYLLEGMKFQMPGEWEIIFDIEAGPGQEQLTLQFEL